MGQKENIVQIDYLPGEYTVDDQTGFEKKPPLGIKGGKASRKPKYNKTLVSGESNNSAIKKNRKQEVFSQVSQDNINIAKGSELASNIPPGSSVTTPLKDAANLNDQGEPKPAGLNDALIRKIMQAPETERYLDSVLFGDGQSSKKDEEDSLQPIQYAAPLLREKRVVNKQKRRA